MSTGHPIGTGFYGKLPHLGDFVGRRLSSELIEPWDQWLQASLAASRTRLGEAWLEQYLTSPLWRFVLSPGVAGQGAWAGVLMPSVDRVGRYFPLTIAASLPTGTNPCRLLQVTDWFERAEALALSVLDDPFSLDDFDAKVLALGDPSGADGAIGPPEPGRGRPNAWHLSTADGPVDGACPTLLDQAMNQVFLAYSLWWSQGSDLVAPSLLACQGLPPPDGFAALLNGDWSGGDWRLLGEAPRTAGPEA
jgi:type VI secretion system protein ImpM